MKWLSKALYFLRVTDSENKLSLTNGLLMIIMFKIAVSPVLSMTDIALLTLGVIKYQSKKVIEKQ